MNKTYLKYYILICVCFPMLTLLSFVCIKIPYTEVPFIMQLWINLLFSAFVVIAITGMSLINDVRSGNI